MRRHRSEVAIANEKHLGKEPSFEQGHSLSRMEFRNSLNWFHSCCDAEDARAYLVEWAECNGQEKRLVSSIKNAAKKEIPLTAAWIARLANQGYRFDEFPSPDDFILSKLVFQVEKPLEPKVARAEMLSIQEKVNNKAGTILVEIEDRLLNDDYDFSMHEYLVVQGISGQVAARLAARLEPILLEVRAAVKGGDRQLREAYRWLSKPSLRARAAFLGTIMKDIERHLESKKRRKPAHRQVAKTGVASRKK